MKAPLRKQLWTKLTALISAQYPQFKPYKAKSSYIWSDELVLSAGDLIAPKTAFIILTPQPKGLDQFTIVAERAVAKLHDVGIPYLMRVHR